MAMDVQRHLKNETVVARPPSAAYRFQKLVRRNKLAVTAVAAVASVLVLGIVMSTWQAVRATRARETAVLARQNEEKQRRAAENARALADTEADRASRNAAESRERLLRLTVANGVRFENEGDFPDALLWFAQGLALSQDDPAKERLHRIRYASVLLHCPKLLHILVHSNVMEYAVFSPDGSRILTTCNDWTARVWDAATGEPITPPLAHDKRVVHGSFSPDGRRVVTASFDNTARVWNSQTGEPLLILKHDSCVCHAEFSPDGRRIVTAGFDQKAQVWDAASGKPSLPPLPHNAAVWQASFSPDGRRIVTAGSYDNTARVWDANTGNAITSPLPHPGCVTWACFSPDGSSVLTCSYDQTTRLWDAATGRPLGLPMKHTDTVWTASFSPNGQQIVTATLDDARVWSGGAKAPLTMAYKHSQELRMWGLYPSFSPDGKFLVMPLDEQSARVYEALTLKPVTSPLPHNGSVYHAAFGPDSRHLVTLSADRTVRVWEVAPEGMWPDSSNRTSFANRAPASPDGGRFLVACGDGAAQIVDVLTGKPIGQPLRHHRHVLDMSFSPNGRSVCTTSRDNTARVWDGLTGEPLTPPLEHPERKNPYAQFTAVSFSPDGERLATAFSHDHGDVRVRIWDLRTGQPLPIQIKPTSNVEHLAFSPDGRWIAAACSDHTARVWDTQTGNPRTPSLPHSKAVSHAAFSHDSALLVTSSYDGTARVWDAATGEPVIIPLQHPHPVRFAGFDSDATHVLTAAENGTWSWALTSDDRPARDLMLEAKVLSGRQIDNSGTLAPMREEELLAGWRQLDSSYGSVRQLEGRRGFSPTELEPLDKDAKQFLDELPFTFRSFSGSSQGNPFCVDLSPYYNETDDRWTTNTLAAFPVGRQQLGGTEFDLHGVRAVLVASDSAESYGRHFPKSVCGIKVERQCRLLHFLHFLASGTYLIHFSNGQKWEIPILPEDGTNTRSLIAWKGLAGDQHTAVEVYQTSWLNPFPSFTVESIDFVSDMDWATPVLLAITVE
jgi:WD40 repeat protein